MFGERQIDLTPFGEGETMILNFSEQRRESLEADLCYGQLRRDLFHGTELSVIAFQAADGSPGQSDAARCYSDAARICLDVGSAVKSAGQFAADLVNNLARFQELVLRDRCERAFQRLCGMENGCGDAEKRAQVLGRDCGGAAKSMKALLRTLSEYWKIDEAEQQVFQQEILQNEAENRRSSDSLQALDQKIAALQQEYAAWKRQESQLEARLYVFGSQAGPDENLKALETQLQDCAGKAAKVFENLHRLEKERIATLGSLGKSKVLSQAKWPREGHLDAASVTIYHACLCFSRAQALLEHAGHWWKAAEAGFETFRSELLRQKDPKAGFGGLLYPYVAQWHAVAEMCAAHTEGWNKAVEQILDRANQPADLPYARGLAREIAADFASE